jgi:hypothetical protein
LGCSPSRNAVKYGWLRKQGEGSARPNEASQAQGDPSQKALVPPTGTAWAVVHPGGPQPVAAVLPGLAAGARGAGTDAGSPAVDTPVPGSAGPDTAYYAGGDHRWNAKAVAALPVALGTVAIGIAAQSLLLLLVGGAIAFTLGLIGSRQCRDRKNRGKGFAIAGMALGAAALFFSLMVLIWAAW